MFKTLVMILAASFFAGVPCMLTGQATIDGSLQQYLFSDFSKSDVRKKNGQIQALFMNYNIITHRMVFTRDDKYYDLTYPEMIDTVFMQGNKFVPVGKAFYEVLFAGAINLYIQHKGELISAGNQVGYGGTSQVASANYISSVNLSGVEYNVPLPADFIVKSSTVYWIRKGNEWFDFLNEKQFLKLFPEKSVQLKDFIKTNRLKIEKPEHLVRLVKYCSNL